MKKLRIGFGFGERLRSKNQVRVLSIESGFKCKTNLLSNHPKRPALIVLCAERITVDAREKG